MNRYQIYLEPQLTNVLDYMAKKSNTSRSQIIRNILGKNVSKYRKQVPPIKTKKKYDALLKMAGFAKEVKRTDISQNIDEIYLVD